MRIRSREIRIANELEEGLNMARMELGDEALEEVVGGTFEFYSGGTICYVQGQLFTCNKYGKYELIELMNANQGLTEGEYLQMALNAGILKPM